MVMNGWIVDGRAGGYIIGRSHDTGNIYMIQRADTADVFVIQSCLEGGEYIINHDAYTRYKDRIEEINSFNEPHDKTPNMSITLKTRMINTYSEPYDKLLLIEKGQFIINKFATVFFFKELEEINNSSNSFMYCNLDLLQI